jgi:glucose/arabinose dehydrogenase
VLLNTSVNTFFSTYAQEEEFRQREFSDSGDPELADPSLKIEEVASGLDTPTTMAFLGPNDILVLEKDKGTVNRIVNGKMLDQPLLDPNVANSVERCMCGIAISKHGTTTYVFLYYTEIDGKDGEDRQGKQPIGNRLYKYELADNKLINPIILVDLPATPGPRHNGGAIIIGPDKNLYVPVGDIDGSFRGPESQTVTQNYQNGEDADGRSGILRITQDGQPVGEGILGNEIPLRLYYAYGIRNSFGLGFDPVSGKLWDTENGPGNSDEINLVEPGFNSGWQEAMGLVEDEEEFDTSELVNFDGKGHYRDPELVWLNTAGPTAVLFMTSDKLGSRYVNEMFVADVHNGRIYHFSLNEDRTHLVLPSPLAGKVIRSINADGLDQIIFGQEFGGITDLKIGPDGYLYVVSVGLGKIFRVVPA